MTPRTAALELSNVSKRYRRTWALQDCELSIPRGKIVALVGPNGAGKSTLLRIAAGLTRPNSGTIRLLDQEPTTGRGIFDGRVSYLDQERPLLDGLRVRDMLEFGRRTNPKWDSSSAHAHLSRLGISLTSRVGTLSEGQKAQVALTLCLAKQPELLLLDEPAAALDPVAREDLLRLLMQQAATSDVTVVLSTHALGDVAAVCDYLVILAQSRVVLSDDIDYILESHRLMTASVKDHLTPPVGVDIIGEELSNREVSLLVRAGLPLADARWHVERPTLDEIVLAYLRRGSPIDASRQSVLGANDDSGNE